jgi:hypothetical protein
METRQGRAEPRTPVVGVVEHRSVTMTIQAIPRGVLASPSFDTKSEPPHELIRVRSYRRNGLGGDGLSLAQLI